MKAKVPSPERLDSTVERVVVLINDILIAGIALLFVVFGGLVYKYDGTSAESGTPGRALYDAAQYGPTIFPVLFAAIVGGSLRSLAAWRLQSARGASAQFVTQCLGSQSLSSALGTQISLRAINPLALLIVVAWCFSPVGSQAALRVVSLDTDDFVTDTTLSAVDTFSEYQYGGAAGIGEAATAIAFPAIASMLAAALLSTRNQDLWGNVRFPVVETLDDSGSTDWLAVPATDNLTYASLSGTPLLPLPAAGNTTFVLPGSYTALTCGTLVPTTGFTNFSAADVAAPDNGVDCGWSAATGGTQFQLAVSMPCNITVNSSKDKGNTTRPARQLVWESTSSSTAFSRAVCDMTTTFVDLDVVCAGDAACSAQRVRRAAPADGRPDRNWTVLDINFYNDAAVVVALLAGLFPNAEQSGGLQPVLAYLSNPTVIVGAGIGTPADVAIDSLDPAVFQVRLAQLLNTLLYLGINATAMTGSFAGFDGQPATSAFAAAELEIAASVHQLHPVVRCHRAWFALLLVAALLVFLVAAAGAALRLAILVPDVLSSISIAFLHNRIAGVVPGCSAWSAADWAHQSRACPLRLADIDPAAAVGRIALVPADDAQPAAIVRAGRSYL